jgi:AcrR family transcriptional regulator
MSMQSPPDQGLPPGRPAEPGPIWTRPEPAGRKPRFSREQIAAVALALADAEGFTAVSMRRVATELGAGTMSLYRYIATKADLVALLDDALMAERLVPAAELPADWRAALALSARRTRQVYLRHPWRSPPCRLRRRPAAACPPAPTACATSSSRWPCWPAPRSTPGAS